MKNKRQFRSSKPWQSERKGRDNSRRLIGIDPKLLAQKPVSRQESKSAPAWRFDEATFHPRLKQNLASRGYTHPTPIQEQAIQPAIGGRDILGIASTGTGKTAAFLIPVVEQLLANPAGIQALVVVPTRELALQVATEFKAITEGMDLYSSCFIGGTSVGSDIKKLRRVNHVVIGTPGRLLDLSNQGALKLSGFSTLILDEFDRMLDMGFIHDVRRILTGLTGRRQTMFFSATIEKSHQSLIDSILKNPLEVRIAAGTSPSELVEQELIQVKSGSNKFSMLLEMIGNTEFRKVLIFAETKRVVNQVGKKLVQSGVKSDVIHGNKSQNYRIKALKQFSEGKVQVLVATDIAARGLDVSDVSHVINYQMPRTMDSYIHRIGRTGRAGKFGRALTFVD